MKLLIQNQNNSPIHIQQIYSYSTYDQQTPNENKKVEGIQQLKVFTKSGIICDLYADCGRKILIINVAKGNLLCIQAMYWHISS